MNSEWSSEDLAMILDAHIFHDSSMGRERL
jgi:hypothetical protein